jgi:predicted transcriptional regulator
LRISDRGAVERILKAVADPEDVEIMLCIRKEAKSAQTVSAETGIPQSTAYRKLDELKESGLAMIDHIVVTSGKKVEFMTITFSELKMDVEEGKLRIDIVPSDETANRRWLSMFRGGG